MAVYKKDYARIYGSVSHSSAGGDESGHESRVINGNDSSYHEYTRNRSVSGGGNVSGSVGATWTVTWGLPGVVTNTRVRGTAWASTTGDSSAETSYLDYVQLLINGSWATIRGRSNRDSTSLTNYSNAGEWHNVTGMRAKFNASASASSSEDSASYFVGIRCATIEAQVSFISSGFRGSVSGLTYDFLEDYRGELANLFVVDGKRIRCSTTGGLFPTPFKVQTNDGKKIIEGVSV